MINKGKEHSFLIYLLLSLFLLTNINLYGFNSVDDEPDNLKKIEKLNQKAQELLNEADEIYSELANYSLQAIEASNKLKKKKHKALELQIDALGLQKEANELEKEVNNDRIAGLKLDFVGEIPLTVKLLEEKVEELFQKADNYRKKSEHYKKEELDAIYDNQIEAQKLEKEALNEQEVIIDFYSGKHVGNKLSDYLKDGIGEEDKVEINEELLNTYLNYVNSADTIIPSELFRHIVYADTFSSANVKQVWDNYLFGERALPTDSDFKHETSKETIHKSQEKLTAENETQKNNTIESDSNQYFKVQVAVKNAPLSQHHLKRIYSDNKMVDMVNEDDWYKYSIGDFKTYAQAEEFKHSLNTQGAFIVSYRDDKKVDILKSAEQADDKKTSKSGIKPEDLIYKVQIAASKNKLSDREINLIYQGNKQVDLIHEDGWYKYSLGKLSEYNQAVKLSKSVDVSGAFIVAYKGDKKVPLTQTRGNLTVKEDFATQDNIIFKVQVAADKEPLSSERLHRVYSGYENIEKFEEDGWYKYAIGTFHNFEEANKLRENSDVKGAFVIAFRNGQKLNVLEAKRANRCFNPVIHKNWLNNSEGLVFRVQIAASLVELSEKQIKNICCINRDVYMVKQNGWYKYSIGNFKTYEESLGLKRVVNLDGAFTVAFKNGQPLNIKEAINFSKK